MKHSYATTLGALAIAATGAGLMYFFDPKSGRRRRTEVHDRTSRACRATAGSVRRSSMNLANHARGLAATITSRFRSTEVPADEILLARIRARIGHAISQPHAIQVKAEHGAVSLTGSVPYREAHTLLKTVACTPGVSAVENHLAIRTV